MRIENCLNIKYSNLPTASVIIVFSDEAWSPLLRTVYSVINRSSSKLLKEVLLIDDFSENKELHEKLDDYVKVFKEKVRIFRLKQPEGLINAKLFGANKASGDVIIFLDPYSEVNEGWLEPLLLRIKQKPTAIVFPIIDTISATTFYYQGDKKVTSVGGFLWNLHFQWNPIPQSTLKNQKVITDPIPSPTIFDGVLAANKTFFFEIGSYNSDMDNWGGENLELSFRVWMCGGSIEIVPCSHVGHVFRNGYPYNDVHSKNLQYLAEIWMDDYKRLFYNHRKNLKIKFVDDLYDRFLLRKLKLKCKSFKWYLDNVIPYKFVPDENVLGNGMFLNAETGLCLDTLQKDEKSEIPIGLFSCQNGASLAQQFSLTKFGQFRREVTCASVKQVENKTIAVLLPCLEINDLSEYKWKWEESGLMRHIASNFCMDVSNEMKNFDIIAMRQCDNSSIYQKWEFV